jgi:hypothetical protein
MAYSPKSCGLDVAANRALIACVDDQEPFPHGMTIEAKAAHIIGKDVLGTDDPRNGLALSHTAHWAFERGLFTVSNQYELIIHKDAKAADQPYSDSGKYRSAYTLAKRAPFSTTSGSSLKSGGRRLLIIRFLICFKHLHPAGLY